MFLDRDRHGYNEQTLPPLIALMDSAAPDHRAWTHNGPTGYFLASPNLHERIQRVIAEAEKLRSSDARFERLGIGLAQGPMIAEFSWFGRLKTAQPPLGSVSNVAHRCAEADDYRIALQTLH